MKLQRIGVTVAVAGLVLATGACGTTKKSDSTSMKDMKTSSTMKMTDAKDSTALLYVAVNHMPMTADVLAGAITKQFPSKFTGDADSGASTLRATLTSLLQSHVYLAGIATGTALAGHDDTKEVAALDQNSVDLSKAIASVYGDKAGTQFLALWRKHIGFFVDYATGKATNDDAKVAKAKSDLAGYGADFGAFLDSATGGILPKAAVVTELQGHVQTLEAAIDAQAAKSSDATALLQVAADHMQMTADALAGAFTKQFPKKFSGDADSGASALRSTLTDLLQEHVYLAGITTATALSGADDTVQAAVLDTNSVALSDAIASVYGQAGGTEFLALWRKHIGFFVDYTTGKATNDSGKVAKAASDLDGYRADFGAFLASATNGGLTKAAVADELKGHVQTLEAAIDAQATEATAAKK